MNTIHRKDCIQGLQELTPGVVDLAFADPPFNIGYAYDVYDDQQDKDRYLQWTRQWMEAVQRALKPTGTFWIAIGDEFAAEIKMIGQRDLGLTCRSWIVWYYTFGVNCTKKFSRSHAHLFHFVKDPGEFTFNQHEIRVPSARQLVYADGRANPNGRLPDDTWILRPQDVPAGFRPDQDTWYFPRVAGTFKERAGFHGCQMPEQLLGRIIRSCSNPAELVLDPFAGSGTTLAVANKLGRRWLGFEVSESYAEKALARIGQTYAGQPLEGAAEPLASAPRTPRGEKPGNTPEPCQAPPLRPLIRAGGGDTVSRCELDRAFIAAFLVASEGFSTDRVIADPELNASFREQCKKFGIPGEPVAWNRELLSMRKAGRLTGLPAGGRTTFRPEELDRYVFASEIAIRKMLDAGCSGLDHILCDPEQAERFDRIARSFAPGCSPLQYRWGALRIRKRAHDIRARQKSISPELLERRLPRFQPVTQVQMDQIKSKPGVYLLRADTHHHLYAGETLDLGARLCCKLEAFKPWQEISPEIQIGVIPFADTGGRQGLWSNLIKRQKPELNLLRLGGVA